MIQIFFVMNKDGIILFSDNYSQKYEDNLVSGFISAIHSFMKQSIFTGDLKHFEVGGFRFIFDIQDIGEDNDDEVLIYAIMADRTDNIASIKPRLETAKWKFIEKYYNQIKDWDGNQEVFEDFRVVERQIFNKSMRFRKETESEILNSVKNFYNTSEDVIGAALISQTGEKLMSFIDQKLLDNILRTLEGRFHSGFTNLNLMLTIEDDGILALVGNKTIICAVLFDRKADLDLAIKNARAFAELIFGTIKKS